MRQGDLLTRARGRTIVLAAPAASRAVGTTAAAHGGVEDEGEVGEQGADPHKGKHLDANDGVDVELVLGGEGNLGGEADDGGNDGGDGEEDAGEEAEGGDGEGEEAGADDERGGAQEDEVEDGAGHEEAVHDLGADAEEGQDGDDLRGEGDLGASEELADEDLDWVEPVELLG